MNMSSEASQPEQPVCNMGDQFAVIVQAVVATLALSTLYLKRLGEPIKNRRPIKIWFFDSAKQAVGALIMHFSNLFLSMAFPGDPCTWYLMGFMLDITAGLLVLWLFSIMIKGVAVRKQIAWLHSGDYGSPPKLTWWARQCTVYGLVVMAEKLVTFGIILAPQWDSVRDAVLRPIRSPRLRLLIVMLFIPFIFNTVMFWVTDAIIKQKMVWSNRDQVHFFLGKTDEQDDLDESACTEDHVLIRKASQIKLL